MPVTDLSRLSDEATVWIFGISPAVSDEGEVLRRADTFLRGWDAHGVPVLSGRELREQRFLVVAAEKSAETSGCSIDRMFGLIRAIERDYAVSMLDASRVFYRDSSGLIRDVPRGEFRDVANDDTIVFDTTVVTLGEIRSGRWEKPARDSWHAALLRRSA